MLDHAARPTQLTTYPDGTGMAIIRQEDRSTESIVDLYVQEGFPTTGTYSQPNMYLGYDNRHNKQRTNPYVRFEIPTLTNGSVITQARAFLFQNVHEPLLEPYVARSCLMASDWYSTDTIQNSLTWNTQANFTVDLANCTDWETTGRGRGWTYWWITDLAQNWVDGVPNNGFTMQMQDENAIGTVFLTRECSVDLCAGVEKPYLELLFIVAPEEPVVSVGGSADFLTPTWDAVQYAETYEVQGQQNGGEWTSLFVGDATSHQHFPSIEGEWCYRVRGDNQGATGDWSAVQCATVALSGDEFEYDDACANATMIAPDGFSQRHTLHDDGDVDWFAVPVLTGVSYQVQIAIPVGSVADVRIETHLACTDSFYARQAHDFTRAARIRLPKPTEDTIYYLRLDSQIAGVFGDDVTYDVTVYPVDSERGAVVIIGGRYEASGDPVQNNIYNVTDAVYNLFALEGGYRDERIYYLSHRSNDSEITPDNPPTRANIEEVLKNSIRDQIAINRPLTIYIMSHGYAIGDREEIYLDGLNEPPLTPSDLNSWLAGVPTNVPINIIIDACYSGSFIDFPGSLSAENRVIVTSTEFNKLAYASEDGSYFSDPFLHQLSEQSTIFSAFEAANAALEEGEWPSAQIDDNGDGIPNTPEDGVLARQRGFGLDTLPPSNWEPTVFSTTLTVADHMLKISADVRDDKGVSQVWALIYPPDYIQPTEQTGPVVLNVPKVALQATDGFTFVGEIHNLMTSGEYRVVITAKDDEGVTAQPMSKTATIQGTLSIVGLQTIQVQTFGWLIQSTLLLIGLTFLIAIRVVYLSAEKLHNR